MVRLSPLIPLVCSFDVLRPAALNTKFAQRQVLCKIVYSMIRASINYVFPIELQNNKCIIIILK